MHPAPLFSLRRILRVASQGTGSVSLGSWPGARPCAHPGDHGGDVAGRLVRFSKVKTCFYRLVPERKCLKTSWKLKLIPTGSTWANLSKVALPIGAFSYHLIAIRSTAGGKSMNTRDCSAPAPSWTPLGLLDSLGLFCSSGRFSVLGSLVDRALQISQQLEVALMDDRTAQIMVQLHLAKRERERPHM